MIEYIQETCKKQWQTVCATQSPSEIMAQMIVIGIICIFLIVLGFMKPHLMGISIVAVVGTGGLALLIREAHEKVLTWLNAQCDAAKIQAMREQDRLDDIITGATQRVPNGDLGL